MAESGRCMGHAMQIRLLHMRPVLLPVIHNVAMAPTAIMVKHRSAMMRSFGKSYMLPNDGKKERIR